jgi:hypothetical protein
MFIVEPIFFAQSPKEVLMIHSGNEEVRHIDLDVPHSANPQAILVRRIGRHYEDDTLVIDTIGLNDKTYVDNYRSTYGEASRHRALSRLKLDTDGSYPRIPVIALVFPVPAPPAANVINTVGDFDTGQKFRHLITKLPFNPDP